MFQRSVSDYSALPDGYVLYRRLLAAQPDHSVSIVSVGFVTCQAQLLQSEGDEYSPLNGVELVRQKVKCIYQMGGVFGQSVGPDGCHPGRGGRRPLHALRTWHCDTNRQGRDHLYALGHG